MLIALCGNGTIANEQSLELNAKRVCESVTCGKLCMAPSHTHAFKSCDLHQPKSMTNFIYNTETL